MSVLGVVGLLLGIAALIVLSYKGVNAFVSSLIAAAIVIITNGMPFWGTFSDSYATGMKNFAGSYFLIFGLAAAYGLSLIHIYRFCHRLSQIALCIAFQLLQDHRRNLLGRIFLLVNGNLVIRSHLSLDGRYGSVHIGDRLPSGRISNEPFTVLCKCHR